MSTAAPERKMNRVPTPFNGRRPENAAYQTAYGRMLLGFSDELLSSGALARFETKVNLVFTSPPFPLNTKKRYGNKNGEEYIEWLSSYGPLLKKMLTRDGSIVMEVGNCWEPGSPVMSTLPIRSLLRFQQDNELFLCQEFVYHNPAKLPSPAQWVNVDRVRVKDSFTKIWWMSPSAKPKADNRRVLREYSTSMRGLLKSRKYNAGKRPSEHRIGEQSFLVDNGGAIPGSVLTFSNTQSNEKYQDYCRENGIELHPARMPMSLASFFINFLTQPGDLVLDPFGGSNTTGAAAEQLKRFWLSIEAEETYVLGSKGRFPKLLKG